MRYNDKVLSCLFEFIRRLVSFLWEVVGVSHFAALFTILGSSLEKNLRHRATRQFESFYFIPFTCQRS